MSVKPWSISQLRDRLQAWGEPPVVNPVKLVDGTLPVDPPGQDTWWATLLWGVAAALVVVLIVMVFVVSPPAPVHFLYADF